MNDVILKTKEQLDIIMNPQRQRLLRVMEIAGVPRTAKELSLELGISPSSVQHHLKKLETLGLVYIDHTETIRGIVAKYYAMSKVIVHVGMEQEDELVNEREILMTSKVSTVLRETLGVMKQTKVNNKNGDIITGIAHLSPKKAEALQNLIKEFLNQNVEPNTDTTAWEYAIMYHCVGGKNE